MPNRYEREIEEILRNLEQPEAKVKPGAGQKFGERFNRKQSSRVRTRQPRLSVILSSSERLLLVAIGAALISGGYAYLTRSQDIISLIFALISVICLIVLLSMQFRTGGPRRSRSVRYENITITPLRRDPLSTLRTRWNLFKLRLRYRRKKEK
jgi:Flp pilus assembly protein TadB